MSDINAFIISFCVSCVLLGSLYMLCPSGNMSAPVKYIFCLCFVCCVVGTAISLPSPDFSDFDKKDGIELLTNQNTATTAQMVFSEALTKQNINFTKVMVDTNKLSDDSIVISKVTVFTTEQASKIVQIIGDDSYEVVVINE